MQKLIIYIYINSTHSGNVVYSCICNRKTLLSFTTFTITLVNLQVVLLNTSCLTSLIL